MPQHPKKTLLGMATGINESKDLPELTSGNFMEDMSRLNSFLNPPLAENVEAPGLGLLEFAETGPAMLMKGMASLVTSPKDITKLISVISRQSDRLMLQFKVAQRNLTNFRRKYQPKGEGYKTSGSISASDEISGPFQSTKTGKWELLDSSTMYRHQFDSERVAKLTKEALYTSRKTLSTGNKKELKKLVDEEASIYGQLRENELAIDELIIGRGALGGNVKSSLKSEIEGIK